jgi:predicted RNA-binding Zn-ribbon protein involved in translation (DUF1610 family)
MLVELKAVASQDFTCPKCQYASLRLHARLPEADGLPEVQCLECPACGEVMVVERLTSITRPDISYWRVRKTGQ